ncbi:phytanoyl-CoA dioxygenase family protein [Phenylobacterium sp.]|uniref:phytanoyl-CoA dioxygenase family protein n=1 Tax=Phenylobacterium sp. TaxID=1871053 RepID=UPI002736D1B5|nr:phytanoyl-CoA dioxygenase family protein [Phenylobacterium sp.]MDP3659421.1 phytanoyl-CoA dioxygenase family protein [Phenylobacterium sp.]
MPTGKLAAMLAELDEHGVVVAPDVLSAAELAAARGAVDELIAADRAAGAQLAGFHYDPDDRNIRIVDLAPRSEVMRSLVEHPLALALVEHALGADFRLSNFSGNRTAPGSGRMGMHADQGFLPSPWPPYAMAFNIGWALDDFTPQNGGTRYIPGSHKRDHGPKWNGDYAEARPIVCRAGSLFAMDGRVWHQTGANVTDAETRTGLFAYYVRPFIVTQRPWPALIPRAKRDELTPRVAELLGFERPRATTDLRSR